MGFLLFLGMCAASLYGMHDMASGMKTRDCKAKLNKEPYNLDQMETILRLHRVKRHNYDGFPILEKDGWQKCLDYVRRQPLTNEEDVDAFIKRYNDIRSRELVDFLSHWEDIYNETYENEIADKKCSKIITFEKKHYLATYGEVYDHAQDLFLNTFFGDLALAEPKIIKERSANTYSEVWALHCNNVIEAEKYYEMCSKVLGKLTV